MLTSRDTARFVSSPRSTEGTAVLFFFFNGSGPPRDLPSSPPRRSPDLRPLSDSSSTSAAETSSPRPRQLQLREPIGVGNPLDDGDPAVLDGEAEHERQPSARRDDEIGRAHV